MRPLLAVVISVVILGGLWRYTTRARPPSNETQAVLDVAAKGRFAAEITLTFSAQPDPFALRSGDELTPAAVLAQFNGQQVLRVTDDLSAGTPVVIDPLPGVIVGANELYLEANPPPEEGNQAHAVRVRITRDGATHAEETFWSEPGTRLSAQLAFSIDAEPDATEMKAPPHDH